MGQLEDILGISPSHWTEEREDGVIEAKNYGRESRTRTRYLVVQNRGGEKFRRRPDRLFGL